MLLTCKMYNYHQYSWLFYPQFQFFCGESPSTTEEANKVNEFKDQSLWLLQLKISSDISSISSSADSQSMRKDLTDAPSQPPILGMVKIERLIWQLWRTVPSDWLPSVSQQLLRNGVKAHFSSVSSSTGYSSGFHDKFYLPRVLSFNIASFIYQELFFIVVIGVSCFTDPQLYRRILSQQKRRKAQFPYSKPANQWKKVLTPSLTIIKINYLGRDQNDDFQTFLKIRQDLKICLQLKKNSFQPYLSSAEMFKIKKESMLQLNYI